MTSSPLYICIECEISSSITDPVALNEHSHCPRCGSSSVVPVDSLLELVKKAKRAEQAQTHTDNTQHRVAAMRAQRLRDAQPLIQWLSQATHGCGNSKAELSAALAAWDGWAWHVSYPWDSDDNPYPGRFTIELVQGIKDGPRWFITLSVELNAVHSFQKGTN